MNQIAAIYRTLYDMYGPQGWWPLTSHEGSNPTKTGSIKGYHPGDYSLPSSRDQTYEVCIGAILTQSVGWVSVEKALLNLKKLDAINPERLLKLGDKQLAEAIRPAGYYNQKARKLRDFTSFFISLDSRIPGREELLRIWGVGRETADSMLLYAFKVPVFVVDAYTRRIFEGLGLVSKDDDYDKIKALFEKSLGKDLTVCQEYHALIVEHAKQCYSKKAGKASCPLILKYAKNACKKAPEIDDISRNDF